MPTPKQVKFDLVPGGVAKLNTWCSILTVVTGQISFLEGAA